MLEQTRKKRQNSSSGFGSRSTPDKRLKKNLSNYTDILNYLLAEVGMTAKARAFVDAVIGASQARADWFELNDYEMGERLPSRNQNSETDSIKKRAQRYRKPLINWLSESNIALVDIEHGGKRQDEEYPTRYRTERLLNAWAEAIEMARQSADWEADPKMAKKTAAKAVAKKLLGTRTPASRGNVRRSDDGSMMVSNMKSAAAFMRKAFECGIRSGHDPARIREELIRKLDVAAVCSNLCKRSWLIKRHPPVKEDREAIHG